MIQPRDRPGGFVADRVRRPDESGVAALDEKKLIELRDFSRWYDDALPTDAPRFSL